MKPNQILKQAAKLLGSKGGTMTKKLYGKKHYQRLAANMNRVLAEKRAVDKQASKGV